MTGNILVTFERLGRMAKTDVQMRVISEYPEQPLEEGIANAVYRYAKKQLASKEFDVSVTSTGDGYSGSGKVDGGRFGTFSWVRVAA